MKYNDLVQDKINRLEKDMERALLERPGHKKLKEIMHYATDGGGKRLRPILMMECYQLFQDDINEVLPFAIALELIHTYSLVHDDLPCMDDDDFRRNRPTVHKQYDETMAVLGGDALLNTAYAILIEGCRHGDTRHIKAAQVMAEYAGVEGMLEGQMLDLYPDVQSEADLLKIYEKKTGSLIQSGTEAGAILGGATKEQSDALKAFGYHLGMAFQIQDDLLDKEVDLEENNMNILHFVTEDEAHSIMCTHTEKAKESLQSLGFKNTSQLENITDSLVARSY